MSTEWVIVIFAVAVLCFVGSVVCFLACRRASRLMLARLRAFNDTLDA